MAHIHSQLPNRSEDRRALKTVLAITSVYTIVEIVGGFLTGSLALLADAVHMFSDNVAIGVAVFAVWLAERPGDSRHSFGYKRAEILAALANGVALVVISIWIFIEATSRFGSSEDVKADEMLMIAAFGFLINLASLVILNRSGSGSLNVRAAARHVLSDLAGSVGTVAAAGTIIATGWEQADAVAGILIGLGILVSAWAILKESVDVLLEASPAGIAPEEVGRSLVQVSGVDEVHDLHIWSITSGFPALAAHVLVGTGEDCHQLRRELSTLLAERFGITHATLQVEHVADKAKLLGIDLPH